MMNWKKLSALAGVLLAGCGGAGDIEGSNDESTSGARALVAIAPAPEADLAAEVYVGESLIVGNRSHAIIAGKPLHLHVDRTRAQLGASEPLTALEVQLRYDGGAIQVLPVDAVDANGELRRTLVRLQAPDDAREVLEFWFKAVGRSGQEYWDSRGGANYRVEVVTPGGPVWSFDEEWSEDVSGPLREGGTFAIAYDLDRLRRLIGDQWYRVGFTFATTAYVSFDGRPAQDYRLSAWEGTVLHAYLPIVKIPEGARSVAVWFYGSGIGQSMYDSNEGANYRLDISPR